MSANRHIRLITSDTQAGSGGGRDSRSGAAPRRRNGQGQAPQHQAQPSQTGPMPQPGQPSRTGAIPPQRTHQQSQPPLDGATVRMSPTQQPGHDPSTDPTRRIPRQQGQGPATARHTGRVIADRYELVRRIGNGGMATVYEAHDMRLDREVAVKMMLPQYASDAQFAARFKQEAQSAAKLQNSRIVSIYDWGLDERSQTYYIVMELLNGIDLKEGIKRNTRLSPRVTAQLASQICEGLAVAHEHGIIHRDIKPQNIMVLPDKSIKIMDFGIARPENSHLTTTQNVMGTAHYIAPEQARGVEVGPTADLYSLGIVMYECVTGKLPFDGPDAITVALKQVKEPPVPPSTIVPQLASDPNFVVLERIILKLMAKDPTQRFQSAAETREAIDAYLAGQQPNIAIPAVGMMDATTRMAKTGEDSVYSDDKKDGTEGGEEEEAARKKKLMIISIAIVVLIVVIGLGVASCTGAFSQKPADKQEQAEEVPIPDVTGEAQDDATKTLEDAGFKVELGDSEYSDTVDVGKVARQDPAGGNDAKGKKGDTVILYLSNGKEPAKTITVPSVTGKTRDEAVASLKELGLDVTTTEGNSDTIDAGKVMDQNPTGGSTVQVGSQVSLTISKGAATTTVPNVVGKSQDEAEQALKGVGLQVNATTANDETVPSGSVIKQSPASGSVKVGTTVTITVSSGPAPKKKVSVPWVVGDTVAQAGSKLAGVGFQVQVNGDNSPDAIVQSMTPSGGSADEGSVVTITAKRPTTSAGTNGNSNGNASNGSANANGNED